MAQRVRRQGSEDEDSFWEADTSIRSSASFPNREFLITVDYITLDDGERPFLSILESSRRQRRRDAAFFGLIVRENGSVVLKSNPKVHDIPHRDTGTPTYDGLTLGSVSFDFRNAQSDASDLVGRALEQADARARLLLEKVQLLRCHFGLHRTLRSGFGGSARGPDRAGCARNGTERISLRRRGGSACAASRRWPRG